MGLEKIANKIKFDKIRSLIPPLETIESMNSDNYSSVKERREAIWDAYWMDMVKSVTLAAGGWFVYEVAKRIF